MSSIAEAGMFAPGAGYRTVTSCRRKKPLFPVDYYLDQTIGGRSINARSAYLFDRQDIESVRGLGNGRHRVRGGRQAIVLDSDDRLYIEPSGDCILEYAAGVMRIAAVGAGPVNATIGIKGMPRHPVATGDDTMALFACFSSICAAPGETSPYRSHPFFRPGVPDVRVSQESPGSAPVPGHAAMVLCLPSDLRYLYAASPLAYYLGASLEMGHRPTLVAGDRSIDLPASYEGFERWAGKMLSRTFQMDCAIRVATTARMSLPGIDVELITGYTPEELMLVNIPDRFLLYMDTIRSDCRTFYAWPTASYVDPVPSSAELLPYLMRSLSAVYAPKSVCLSERDVVSRSVKRYKAQRSGRARGKAGAAEAVVLPSLYPAQAQHWYADGYPVDASLSSLDALRNRREYGRNRRTPGICVVCNERSMAREARLVTDLLEGIAQVEVRADLGRDDLLHTFSEGYDLVHFAGHCERSGLTCNDGHADLSRVDACNVPVFFLNSCQSHRQGIPLIGKGAVCGVTAMFRLLDEAAFDVCTSFYRMLACGYPVMTSFLASRECSAIGTEYLLIGDGSYTVFNGGDFRPFYKLCRNGYGFTLQCNVPGGRGLIARLNNGFVVPDTGFEVNGLKATDLPGEEAGFDGMCLYGGRLYGSVASAVSAALIDLRRTAGRQKGRNLY